MSSEKDASAAGRGRSSRGLAYGLIAALAGAAAALAFLPLVPAATADVGPARISMGAALGNGDTSLRFPPLGAVSADTHTSPLTLELALVEIDVSEVTRSVEVAVTQRRLEHTVEAGLRSLAASLGVTLLLCGTAAGAALLALAPGRRGRYILIGAAGGAVAMITVLGLTAASFDAEAFGEPRFSGALTRAPVVIEALGRGDISIPEVRSRYKGAAERLSGLMAVLAEPDTDPRSDSVAILHIGDVHSNPIGIEIANQLARRFDVEAILDTGDLTNFGVDLETRMVDLVEHLPAPYLFVPGNHDSQAVRGRLERSERDITVLDRRTVEVGGVRILGWADPTYTNWDRLAPEEAARVRLAAGEEIADEVRRERPDVLAVHDRRVAVASLGDVPLVLSGHYHRRIYEEVGGTRVLGVGTTGASGFKSFTLEAAMDYEAQILYFRDASLVAIDYVTFSGLGGEFQIQRELMEPVEPEDPPAEGDEEEIFEELPEPGFDNGVVNEDGERGEPEETPDQ